MGDPRLLQVAEPVTAFGTPGLEALLEDMRETMAANDGAGLAAPQIGVPLRVVIFGSKANPRYPDAPEVPFTVLLNPVVTPLGSEEEEVEGKDARFGPGCPRDARTNEARSCRRRWTRRSSKRTALE